MPVRTLAEPSGDRRGPKPLPAAPTDARICETRVFDHESGLTDRRGIDQFHLIRPPHHRLTRLAPSEPCVPPRHDDPAQDCPFHPWAPIRSNPRRSMRTHVLRSVRAPTVRRLRTAVSRSRRTCSDRSTRSSTPSSGSRRRSTTRGAGRVICGTVASTQGAEFRDGQPPRFVRRCRPLTSAMRPVWLPQPTHWSPSDVGPGRRLGRSHLVERA
jgi:hypothetical protein